jgi:hypothetical protein
MLNPHASQHRACVGHPSIGVARLALKLGWFSLFY